MDRKIRINIIDILIVLILAAAIAVFGYYAMGKWETNNSLGSESAETLEYTLFVNGVGEEFKDLFVEGDSLREVRKGADLGVIKSVSVSNMRQSALNSDEGTYIINEYPDKYDITIVVNSAYKKGNNGPYIDDVELKVGKTLTFRTEHIAVKGVILDVKR